MPQSFDSVRIVPRGCCTTATRAKTCFKLRTFPQPEATIHLSVINPPCNAPRAPAAWPRQTDPGVQMTARNAALLSLLMVVAITFMGMGVYTVGAGSSQVSSDGYGISTPHQTAMLIR